MLNYAIMYKIACAKIFLHLHAPTLARFDSEPLLVTVYSGNVRPLFIRLEMRDEKRVERVKHGCAINPTKIIENIS